MSVSKQEGENENYWLGCLFHLASENNSLSKNLFTFGLQQTTAAAKSDQSFKMQTKIT